MSIETGWYKYTGANSVFYHNDKDYLLTIETGDSARESVRIIQTVTKNGYVVKCIDPRCFEPSAVKSYPSLIEFWKDWTELEHLRKRIAIHQENRD